MKGGDSLIDTLRASWRRWATWSHQKDIRQRIQEVENSKRRATAEWLQDAKPYLRNCVLAGPARDGNRLANKQRRLSTLQVALTERLEKDHTSSEDAGAQDAELARGEQRSGEDWLDPGVWGGL
ncbi:hypothetical protein B0A48_00276 [Cryoendolithus antarcticus]|uniref:Uncharacterized protein n=1 Tax=Cryoendolithus antarcticus TaxID=1507870 RepID=A0A1V8TUA4_9PEZI|nr:hypothetical protein B0A48_00276 [Cryoendolithus antarcticus]